MQTYTRSKVEKACKAAGIAAEFSGRGRDFDVTLADRATMRRFCKLVAPFGGFRTGWGGWVLRPDYASLGDWNDRSSRWHC